MKVPEQLQFLVNARAPQHRCDARMDGSVVVITGATSGVGYQAAHALDRVLGRAVWDLSERLVGISDPAGPNAGSPS